MKVKKAAVCERIAQLRTAATWAIALAAWLSADCAPAAPTGETQPLASETITASDRARPAREFVDSIGVCAHLGYAHSPYVTRFPEVAELLLECGIRHVRTDPVSQPPVVRNARELAAKGVRFCYIMHGNGDLSTIPAMLGNVRDNFADCLDFIEGHNEPDMSFRRRPGLAREDPEAWVPGMRAWMQEIWRLTRQDPLLRKIPVLGCAMAHPNRVGTQVGDLQGLVDVANLHAYPGGRPPERTLADYLRWSRPMYGELPHVITETGYHTALDNPPHMHKPASQAAKADYMPRLHLDYFRAGIERAYSYQFVDDRTDEDCRKRDGAVQEAHFGLVDYQLRPTPAYHAVKNLIAILDDVPGDLAAQSLEYSITGPKGELRRLLLEKHNGEFYLAVWRTATVWDEKERKDIVLPPAAVTVQLKKSAATVRVFRPTNSARPEETLRGTSKILLDLDGQAVILAIQVR
ncbi:MAG: hypothetical protein ACOY3P_20485 [Planctomycetota bacterium]